MEELWKLAERIPKLTEVFAKITEISGLVFSGQAKVKKIPE